MKPEKMVRSIIRWMFIGLIALFIGVWFLSGGPRQVWTKATELSGIYSATNTTQVDASGGGGIWNMFSNPATGEWFKLPWQPALPQGTIAADPDAYFSEEDADTALYDTPLRIERVIASDSYSNEYVEFLAYEPVDLTGWSLRTSSGSRFPFPLVSFSQPTTPPAQEIPQPLEDLHLSAGESILLFPGQSPHGHSRKEGSVWFLYIGSLSSLWNSQHDTLELLNEYGEVVDSYTY